MKLRIIAIAIAFAVPGFAAAASVHTLPPVHVSSAEVASCTPPADAPACADFHRWIRAHFSKREIGMLFGTRTSYPENLTGGIDRLQKRYQALTQEYVAQVNAASGQFAAK